MSNIIVEGIEYSTKMSTETNLFNKRIIRNTDGKSFIGTIDKIKKISTADNSNVIEIDINKVEIKKKVSIDMSVFFG